MFLRKLPSKWQKCGMILLGDSMASRVEKYGNTQVSLPKRSQRNQDLYDEIEKLNQSSDTDLEKLYNLFENFDNQGKSFDDGYEYTGIGEDTRESLYSILDETYYNPFDQMVQREYEQVVAEQHKVENLVDTITDQLDVLEHRESRVNSIPKYTSTAESTNQSSRLDIDSMPSENKKIDTKDLSFLVKPSLSSKKILSYLRKDEKTEERRFYLKVKRISLFLLILLLGVLLFLFYYTIR